MGLDLLFFIGIKKRQLACVLDQKQTGLHPRSRDWGETAGNIAHRSGDATPRADATISPR